MLASNLHHGMTNLHDSAGECLSAAAPRSTELTGARCAGSRRILKEERNYILQMIKKIRASGANVLLIQKSILRDAVTDLSLHYLVRRALPACTYRGCVRRPLLRCSAWLTC